MRDPIVLLQDLLPQPWLAHWFGRVARSRRPWLRRLLIGLWMRIFHASLADAARQHPDDYESFEDFFTRELAPGARPQPADPLILSAPADGFLHEFGVIRAGLLMQAKGIQYPVGALLHDGSFAEELELGWYATIYLSPADYHRVHAPCDALLRSTTEIPGRAYSVTQRTERVLPELFCRNERLVCRFDTPAGPMALVMVGAMLVTGIETAWRDPKPIARLRKAPHAMRFDRGMELGRFTLGSTVIVALARGAVTAEAALKPGQRVRVGDPLGLLQIT